MQHAPPLRLSLVSCYAILSILPIVACRGDGAPVLPGRPRIDLPEIPPRSGPMIIECGASLPDPQGGASCVVTPAQGESREVLLRGTVLLADRVLHGGEVLIGADGRIACAACSCPSSAPASVAPAVVACRDGVVSPALINAHDHIGFTKTAPVAHGEFRYNHRHEWRRGVPGDPNRPRLHVPGGSNTAAMQWGELRHLLGGATSIVGAGGGRGVLRNLDVGSQEGISEPPVDFDTFPLGDSGGVMITSGCAYPSIRDPANVLRADAYLPHIAEGINLAARNEFLCLSSQTGGGRDLISPRTGVIHAIGLNVEDAQLLAARHAAVIWSPRSNIDLYGHTAQVPMLDRAGVLIALGTDWVASGSMNLLRELECARFLNERHFGGYLSDESLWRMVTLNAALATATLDVIGQLRPGHVADIAVFRGSGEGGDATRRDHGAVVRAGVSDVLLVMRGGLPLYGEAGVMEGLGHTDASGCEALDVCGSMKRLCAARETGKTLLELEAAAGKPIYELFACGTPRLEPSCVPFRKGEFTGEKSSADPDGDGRTWIDDNCPRVFNPLRPMDRGVQPDADGDGLGDACDPCPLDPSQAYCLAPDPGDRDGDGVEEALDNCPGLMNPDQTDTDMDGLGDECDGCPAFANPMAGPCPFTVKELRDPRLGRRPRPGTKVVVRDLLVLALRTQRSLGFHARDLSGSQDYAGIMVYMPGTQPPRAKDGTPIQPGQVVTLRGTFSEFSRQDQIEDVSELLVTGMAQVAPLDVKTADLKGGPMAAAERLENLLVRLRGVTMKRKVPPLTMTAMEDDFYVTDDPSQTCEGEFPPCARVGDFLLDGDKPDMQPPFAADGTLSEIIGVVSGFRDFYSVEIRTLADLVP